MVYTQNRHLNFNSTHCASTPYVSITAELKVRKNCHFLTPSIPLCKYVVSTKKWLFMNPFSPPKVLT